TALSASEGTDDSWRLGTDWVYPLFSTQKTHGSRWMAAKFIASWTSPFWAPPSPKAIQVTESSPSSLEPQATPTPWVTWLGWGPCWETIRSLRELQCAYGSRPAVRSPTRPKKLSMASSGVRPRASIADRSR